MKKYILKAGKPYCVFDLGLDMWVSNTAARTAIYTDADFLIANDKQEMVVKYGKHFLKIHLFEHDFPFNRPPSGTRSQYFFFFVVPDANRPLIEVRPTDIEVEETSS